MEKHCIYWERFAPRTVAHKRETGAKCATGVTREYETSDPSRFPRESCANNEIRFTNENDHHC